MKTFPFVCKAALFDARHEVQRQRYGLFDPYNIPHHSLHIAICNNTSKHLQNIYNDLREPVREQRSSSKGLQIEDETFTVSAPAGYHANLVMEGLGNAADPTVSIHNYNPSSVSYYKLEPALVDQV